MRGPVSWLLLQALRFVARPRWLTRRHEGRCDGQVAIQPASVPNLQDRTRLRGRRVRPVLPGGAAVSTFAVGEMAELVYSRFGHDGTECTVTGPLQERINKITAIRELAYAIDVRGKPYMALPDQLRKKRPPQDWVTLCNLHETAPERELETA
jgi:hypothetical protein